MPMTKDYNKSFKDKALALKQACGWQCQMCHKQCYRPGERARSKKKVLTVHHINGDTRNDKLTNLIALCAECHLRIETMNRKLRKRIEYESAVW